MSFPVLLPLPQFVSVLQRPLLCAILMLPFACGEAPATQPTPQARSVPAELPATARATHTFEPTSSSAFSGLQAGISLDDLYAFLLQRGPVHNVWPAPPSHQFTTLASAEIRAVTASVGHPSLLYYFIFQDGRLARIVAGEWSRAEGAFAPPGPGPLPLADRCRFAAERARRILSAPSIDIDQFEQQVAADLSAVLASRAAGLGMTHEATGVAPAQSAEAIEAIQSLRARFDPLRLRCGMPLMDLEALMGPPCARQPLDDGRLALVFGENASETSATPSLLVLISEGSVESIYSPLFYELEDSRALDAHTDHAEAPAGALGHVTFAGQSVEN